MFLLKNVFILLLFVIFIFRFFTAPTVNDFQKDYKTKAVLINPIQIKDSQVVLYTTKNHKIVSYSVPKELEVGDIIQVSGDKYYDNIYTDGVEIIGKSKLRKLYKFKVFLIDLANLYLPQPHSSLFNGIMWGTKPDISDDFRGKLVLVGIIHIVVVSGYNLSIIFSLALVSLRRFGLKTSTFFGVLLALIYSLLVGFDPPIIRALIMGLLMAVGKVYGQVIHVLYLLIVSALLMLVLNPSLTTSVSFQLTVSATMGILLFSEPLNKILKSRKWFLSFPKLIQEDLIASFSAQISVMPLIVFYFNGVSWVSFIINPLILWMVPLSMFLGAIFLVFASINMVGLASFSAYILQSCLTIIIDFVNFFASIPNTYAVLNVTVLNVITFYIFVFFFYLYVKKVSEKYAGE